MARINFTASFRLAHCKKMLRYLSDIEQARNEQVLRIMDGPAPVTRVPDAVFFVPADGRLLSFDDYMGIPHSLRKNFNDARSPFV